MELRHLRYFVAVAEELSFTRAAERLGIAQPPLSQQIARLERDLGVRLLHRTTRSVRLTAAGEVLLREARTLLAREGELRRVVRHVGHGASGAVRIGAIPSAFSGLLLRLLPAHADRHPGVLPLVYEIDGAAALDALVDGQIDVAILRGTDPREGVRYHPLAEEPLVVALPAAHPLAGAEHVELAELAGETFVGFPRAQAPSAFDAIVAACAGAGFTPSLVYEAANDHTLVGFVAAGLGVSLVPACTANLRMPGVTFRPLRGSVPAGRLCVAVPAARASQPARHVVELARELAGPDP